MGDYLIKASEIEDGMPGVVELFHGTEPALWRKVKRLEDKDNRGAVYLTDNPEAAGSYTLANVVFKKEALWAPEIIASKHGQNRGDVIIGAKVIDFDSLEPHRCWGVFEDVRSGEIERVAEEYRRKMGDNPHLARAAKEYFDSQRGLVKLANTDRTRYAQLTKGLLKFKVLVENPKVEDMEGHHWGTLKMPDGTWSVPPRGCQFEAVKRRWDDFVKGNFEKGFDSVFFRNIKDYGFGMPVKSTVVAINDPYKAIRQN